MLEQALRFAFVAVSAFMAARLFWLTDTYAVDILFLDHWYYFEGLFRDHSLFDLFRWQHGPHRQGAGFLLTKVIAGATGWNLRAESFALCGLVCTAAAMAWWLKHRVAGPFNWGDIAVPLIFLSPLQFATFVNTPNPAHSALPLLLIVCVALTWEIERPWLRYMVLMILNVIVVHTGFGIFAGIVLAFLFACEILRIRNANESESIALPALALVVSLCAMAWFFVGYDTRITLPDSGAAEGNW